MVLNVLLLLDDEGLEMHYGTGVDFGTVGGLGQDILRDAAQEGDNALVLTLLPVWQKNKKLDHR